MEEIRPMKEIRLVCNACCMHKNVCKYKEKIEELLRCILISPKTQRVLQDIPFQLELNCPNYKTTEFFKCSNPEHIDITYGTTIIKKGDVL